jgi:molecular chaperone GrpE
MQQGEEQLVERPVEAAEAPPEATELAALTNQLEEEKQKAADNLAGWQRAAADFANYRRRAEQDKNELIRYANANLILKILPILDDFERAMQTMPNDRLAQLTWVDGIFLIERKLRAVLESEGLQPIPALGQEFDPAFHEAVLQEETPEASRDGKVLAELQKGYKLNEKVLRPTMVKVGKKIEK